MAQRLTFIVVAIMSILLLVFTASRTLDLLQTMLPTGQQSAFAYLGLVAFDGGLLGWSFFFAHGARGQYQRAIALLMVILSLIAVGISTVADLYLSAASKGLVSALSEGQRLAVLLAVGGIICANITAFFLVHITDPDRLRAMATESARDVIHAETLRQISQVAPIVAAQVAPQLTRQWVVDTCQQLIPGSSTSPAPLRTVDAAPAVNIPQPAVSPQGQAQPVAPPATQHGKRGFFRWLKGAQPHQPQTSPPPVPPQPARRTRPATAKQRAIARYEGHRRLRHGSRPPRARASHQEGTSSTANGAPFRG